MSATGANDRTTGPSDGTDSPTITREVVSTDPNVWQAFDPYADYEVQILSSDCETLGIRRSLQPVIVRNHKRDPPLEVVGKAVKIPPEYPNDRQSRRAARAVTKRARKPTVPNGGESRVAAAVPQRHRAPREDATPPEDATPEETPREEMDAHDEGTEDAEESKGRIREKQVGIGAALSTAIAIIPGSNGRDGVKDEVEILPIDHRTSWFRRKFENVVLGKRPVLCRVFSSTTTDVGFNVCRMSESTQKVVGVEEGDAVKIEALNDPTLGDSNREITATRKKVISTSETNDELKRRKEHLRKITDHMDSDERRDEYIRDKEANGDIPAIFVDMPCRRDLGIINENHDGANAVANEVSSGLYKPVRVSREPMDIMFRIIDDLTTPVVVGAAVVVLGAREQIGDIGAVIVFAIAALWAVFTAARRTRRYIYRPNMSEKATFVRRLCREKVDNLGNPRD